MLLSLLVGNTLLIALLCSLTYCFYKFLHPVLPSKIEGKNLPFVSVVIPARNEEAKIGRCLKSIIDQDYPNLEIVVIDDRSTDRTGEIIEELARTDSRVKHVKGKDAPDGWVGKCNALAHAVGYASGDWYVFTDADTYHHPNSVRDAVSHALKNKADLVSFVPVQELGSFAERLVMPTLLSSFLLGDPLHRVNVQQAKLAYAYGQYILCRRSSYNALGGHQSVRDEIVEDHALGRVFKEKGYKIMVGDGRRLYRVRMYLNLETMWLGWTKNLYSLIDSKIANLLAILTLLNLSLLGPWISAALLIGLYFTGDTIPYFNLMASIVMAQFVMHFLWFNRTLAHHAGVDWRHYFLTPFGSIGVTILYFHAAYLVLSGSQVNWKGRRYTVNTHKTIQPGPAMEKPALSADRSDR